MKRFYDLPIHTKFKWLVTGTVSLAGLFVFFVFMALIFKSQSEALDKRINIQAKSVIRAAQTALIFNDSDEIGEILAALAVDVDIVDAVILLEDNSNYANYSIEEGKREKVYRYERFFPSLISKIKSYKKPLKYARDSYDENNKTGRLILNVNLYDFYTELFFSFGLSFLIAIFCLIFILKFTGRIINRIINPILVLAETATNVAANQDYTLRAKVFERDEIGLLTENINNMILQVQLRDDKLEETVRKRTAALEKAYQEAKEANRAKSEFIANISHEIRTPMNAILNKNRFALQTKLTSKQRDYLTAVESSAILLLSIINDTLDLSKIEAGKFQLDKVDFCLSELLSKLSIMFASDIEKKGLELILSYPLTLETYIVGDDLRLSQVLINLIANAIKFTEKGVVVVSIELFSNEEKQVGLCFSVRDTGTGISDEYLKNLFNSFTQADVSTTRKYGGTGLGLAISQKLINLMGGVIEVESHLGQGSDFFFNVSFNKSEERLLNSLTSYKAAIKKINILLLNDNAAFQMALDRMFAELEVSLHTVTDLNTAMTALDDETITYDLFLLDWRSVKINALFSQQIFEDFDKLIPLPIVMMTSLEDDIYIEKRYPTLSKYVVNKPITAEALVNAISIAVNQQSCIKTILSVDKKQVFAENMAEAHILLVEDNVINQQIACELLEMQGLQVSIANNGKEAISMMAKHSFDLVLMDIQMPEMDGYQASIMIRKNFSKESLPIVAMTAHAMGEDKEKCIAVGMNEHIAKPIEPDIFYKVITKYLCRLNKPLSIQKELGSPTLFPKMEGIDFHEGLLRLRGNQSLYIKLLQMFIDGYEHCIKEVRQQLIEGDIKAAKVKLHTVKGAAANLGAKTLSAVASELESELETHHTLQGERQLIDLANEIDRFIVGIQAIPTAESLMNPEENKTSISLSTLDILELRRELEALEQKIEAHDFSANTQIQTLLEKTPQTEAVYQDFKMIEQELRKFNFEKASILIISLKKRL